MDYVWLSLPDREAVVGGRGFTKNSAGRDYRRCHFSSLNLVIIFNNTIVEDDTDFELSFFCWKTLHIITASKQQELPGTDAVYVTEM